MSSGCCMEVWIRRGTWNREIAAFVFCTPRRETLPQLNASLIRAWTRGRERVSEEGRSVSTLSGLSTLPGEVSPAISPSGVPTRIPAPIPEDLQQLRQLADGIQPGYT